MKSYQPKSIKEHNQQLLIKLLKEKQDALTKSQLAQEAGLSVVTINKLLPELVASNLITESEHLVQTGGRQATAYQFNAFHELLLIIQFIELEQKMVLKFYLVDLLGRVMLHEQLSNITLDNFRTKLKELNKRYPEIQLIVTGIPGVEINEKLKIMDFRPFKDLALHTEITQIIPVHTIIENDINATTFGFATGIENKVIAGIYFPENFPPGAALVIHNKLFHGSNHLSGEIKHLPNLSEIAFPLSALQAKEVVTTAVQAVIAMYDPHEIILFIPKEWYSFIHKDAMTKHLANVFSYGVSPSLHFSRKFDALYLDGLIKIGLQHLE